MRTKVESAKEEMLASKQNAFGEFLRSRRKALLPEAGGSRTIRRTPGLRREEVAERAGIGHDWYVRLEQGRAISPSTETIDALARALRLNKVEHTHLQRLASRPKRVPFVRETVPEDLHRMLRHLSYPAYITGRRWDLLAWNQAAEEFLGGLTNRADQDRNLLLLMLTAHEMKNIFASAWETEARKMVALFRVTYDLWADDPAYRHLREQLHDGCAQFEDWWNAHEVRSGGATQKLLHHPRSGPLCFSIASFQATDDPSLRLAIYTPL